MSMKSIAERGISLLATAHGHSLGSLMANPELRVLLGGVNSVRMRRAAFLSEMW